MIPAKKTSLTSITKRCEILGNYYRDDINNPDPSVFIHLAKWHNQDVNAIRQKIKNPENLAILNQHHNAMNQSFSEGSASYLKIATTYYNYGLILSREVNASAIPENKTLKGVNELCQSDTNLIEIDSSEESTDESSGDDLDVLSDFCRKTMT